MNSSSDTPALPAEIQLIAAEAAQLEAETAPPDAADTKAKGETAAPVDYQAEAKDLMAFTLAMLVPFYPCLEDIYTPDTVTKLSSASARLMEKYGFTFGEFLTKWGPEIAFLIVAGPLVPKTYKAIKAETKRLEEDQRPATPMQPIVDLPAAGALHSKV